MNSINNIKKKSNGFITEFKTFILRGNVIDMAVGLVIGLAFSRIINSLVDDIIMPPLGLLLGKIDFSNIFITLNDGLGTAPYRTLAAAKEAGAVTINLGLFINAIISFLIVGLTVFCLIKSVNKISSPVAKEVDTKDCPKCFSTISLQASRCPFCTSEISS